LKEIFIIDRIIVAFYQISKQIINIKIIKKMPRRQERENIERDCLKLCFLMLAMSSLISLSPFNLTPNQRCIAFTSSYAVEILFCMIYKFTNFCQNNEPNQEMQFQFLQDAHGLNQEELQEKIKQILEILQSKSTEKQANFIFNTMLATQPYIKDIKIFDDERFIELLTDNFPEITNPRQFSMSLKELYQEFIDNASSETTKTPELITKIIEIINSSSDSDTEYTSSNSSNDGDNFISRIIIFCRQLENLIHPNNNNIMPIAGAPDQVVMR